MSTPFPADKLLDFFRYFDPSSPQCVEAVRRLERSLAQKAPELLTNEAYWVEAWRTRHADQAGGSKPLSVNISSRVAILAQHNAVSCGQTACAMAINSLTGQHLTDNSFGARYGFALLAGLQKECPKHEWWDAGNISPAIWDPVLRSLAKNCPVVAAGNGPFFSPSGHGHIMLITGVSQKTVTFADPNGGRWREVSRTDWENAPRHPDGNFVFLALPRA